MRHLAVLGLERKERNLSGSHRDDPERYLVAPARQIPLVDGGMLEIWPRWLDAREADRVFDQLRDELPWSQQTIRMFGKPVPQPRLTCWIGDPESVYVYSGLTNRPLPWTATLAALRARLQSELGLQFNSVLGNLYRSERDSIGWHSDDERELGDNPTIASLSLGATRRFVLQHKQQKDQRVELPLHHGELLVMSKTTQRHWKHAVPKQRQPIGPRINLTFRFVRPSD